MLHMIRTLQASIASRNIPPGGKHIDCIPLSISKHNRIFYVPVRGHHNRLITVAGAEKLIVVAIITDIHYILKAGTRKGYSRICVATFSERFTTGGENGWNDD